jgi:hypothetical protein
VELNGTSIVNGGLGVRVFGTRQNPVRYENGVNVASGINYDLSTMSPDDKNFIKRWLP